MTPNVRSSRSGITLVELIITSTIMAVMLLTVVPLFNVTSRGYTSMEVSTVLSAGAQNAVTRIQNRLSENKRLFGNDSVGTAFLARVTPNLTSTPMAPLNAATGTLLPTIAPNASLSPSSTTFSSGNVGNSLFFVSGDKPVDASTSVRVDTFIFNYYYLSLDTTRIIGGGNFSRDLWEWHSVPYVDYLQLMAVSPTATRNAAVTALVSAGYTYAFDSSTGSVTAAFYTLTSGSPYISAAASHNVVRATSGVDVPKKMIQIIRGISGSGSYIYSVSPNTGGSFTHPHTVPEYGTASGNFPSGFETMVVGPAGNRRVFARLVMAARGSFKGIMAYEQVLLVAARDLW
jgi:hypothetical protein